MRDHPDEQVAAAGVTGPLRLDDMLYMARRASRLAPVQCVRAECVLGDAHVRSAALHARRALEEGRNQADRVEVEFLRYLAGTRQIKHALEKMGLQDQAPDAVVVALGEGRTDALRYFIDQLGLKEDDALLDARRGDLEAFGITAAQLEATTPDRRDDLVLEAVAEVDLLR